MKFQFKSKLILMLLFNLQICGIGALFIIYWKQVSYQYVYSCYYLKFCWFYNRRGVVFYALMCCILAFSLQQFCNIDFISFNNLYGNSNPDQISCNNRNCSILMHCLYFKIFVYYSFDMKTWNFVSKTWREKIRLTKRFSDYTCASII